jgi:tRNA U34 5-methylaminomethyl-2-thiouridine-forming methyltransferase MnmC
LPDLQVVVTKDGSHTLFVPALNEHYHSTFGAIQESEFIFINTGLRSLLPAQNPTPENRRTETEIHILEVGFGTGLNALLTQIEAAQSNLNVFYTALEAHPLEQDVWSQLNFHKHLLQPDAASAYKQIHLAGWNQQVTISPGFLLHKIHGDLRQFAPGSEQYHLIYFDAFGPDVQPELWTPEIFIGLYNSLKTNGVLVTYSVKGTVVRALKAAGFTTQKLPGPPGKREILRATRPE